MIRLSELKLPLDHRPEDIDALVLKTLALQSRDVVLARVFKRSIDARKADLVLVHIVDVELANLKLERSLLSQHADNPHIVPTPDMAYRPVRQFAPDAPRAGPRPVVVGFGPSGIFAALLLAQMGLCPIVLERGKTVRERTVDTWGLWRQGVLDPESNAQFGEGGAGTFSDGKLWSQIKDPRYLGRKVMEEFVRAGAPSEILVAAHPHIGTFKLVKVVEHMRQQITALGGEIRFRQKLTDLMLEDCQADGLRTRRVRALGVLDLASDTRYELAADHAILALGHSARDTFAMLHASGVAMVAKPFSIGFRIEHPQGLIDRARWGRHAGHPLLGAAEYKLVHHASNGRSVYSFCMCPGGTVVAATSEAGCVATNGMSQYSRNERNANAGIVVGIGPADFPVEEGIAVPLAGINLQRQLESAAFTLGGSAYTAPGQRVGDFTAGTASTKWGEVEPSYKPGVTPTDLSASLPAYAIDAIREALPVFGRKIKGFDMADAVLTGVETRTSAPLNIPRADDFQSVNVRGLYPVGEGAGYAGGILSAGVDGIRAAEMLALDLAA